MKKRSFASLHWLGATLFVFICAVAIMVSCGGDGDGDGSDSSGNAGGCANLQGTWRLDATLIQTDCPNYLVLECLNPTGTIIMHCEGSTMTIEIDDGEPIVGQLSITGDSFTFEATQTDQSEGCTMNSVTVMNGTLVEPNQFTGTFKRTYSFSGLCGGLEGTGCTILYQVQGIRI